MKTAHPCVQCGEPKPPRATKYCSLQCRLLSRKVVEGQCWVWRWNASSNGYGRLPLNGRSELVHRLSYQEFVGPIPDGLHVCHSCDNRACWNPGHLWLGTRSDNIKDAVAKGRWVTQRGEKHKRAVITAETVRSIRASPLGKTLAAKQFGVSRTQVSRIRRRESWKHVH